MEQVSFICPYFALFYIYLKIKGKLDFLKQWKASFEKEYEIIRLNDLTVLKKGTVSCFDAFL